MRLISKSEFAKERGVTAGRVSHWLRDGRIAEVDGKIDADQAHADLDAALDRTKGMRRAGNITSTGGVTPAEQTSAPPPGEPRTEALPLDAEQQPGAADAAASAPGTAKDGTRDTSGYWEHKAKREKFEAELAEMKYLQTAGVLVQAPGVRKEAMETARSVRNAILAIPDRIASVLDPANPARAHKLLTGEIQKVLRELSVGLEERAVGALGPGGSGAPAAPGGPPRALL